MTPYGKVTQNWSSYSKLEKIEDDTKEVLGKAFRDLELIIDLSSVPTLFKQKQLIFGG